MSVQQDDLPEAFTCTISKAYSIAHTSGTSEMKCLSSLGGSGGGIDGSGGGTGTVSSGGMGGTSGVGGTGMGRLASVGVFNCFYGNQYYNVDADFYIDAESDLRTLLRGIAKLSISVNVSEEPAELSGQGK